MKKQNLLEIQKDLILRYHIIIDEHSTCTVRMHAHIDERRVCKWKPKNSMRCTFDLFHEVGHIETTKLGMRRAEQEYYATCWAIDRCKEYQLAIPERILHIYQRYILYEEARGKERGGKDYPEMNIYKYAGFNKTIEEFKKEIDSKWAIWINKEEREQRRSRYGNFVRVFISWIYKPQIKGVHIYGKFNPLW